MKKLLNVGGASKEIPIPPYYAGWEHHLLDIDPAVKPDVLMDARQLHTLPGGVYDAVYCSHNLEHYHRHDGAKVINGFCHALKDDGFVEVRVPDIYAVMKYAVARGMDLDDELYRSALGPILVRDVIYGLHGEIERTGQDFYAHKSGFTRKSLVKFFAGRGFHSYSVLPLRDFEVRAYFFKGPISPELKTMLGLK